MNWTHFPIVETVGRASDHIRKCLSIGASRRLLSRELLSQFENASGNIFAIADDCLALERIVSYEHAGWYADLKLDGLLGLFPSPPESWPIDGLFEFIKNYLHSSKQSVAVLENLWQNKSKSFSLSKKPQLAFHQDNVYYLLSDQNADYEFVATSITEAGNGKWSIGCLASEVLLPPTDVLSAALIKKIAARTEHIFTDAFDGEGFLVWTRDRIQV